MEKQKRSTMVRIPVIILAVSAMLLSASPCVALIEVSGETMLDVGDTIYDSVSVNNGGTLNLLDGGVINGAVTIGDGGVLNMKGGYISGDVYIAGGSEVNIKGGGIGGDVFWDFIVESLAKVTVYGTDFEVMYGTIDSSGTYFTPDAAWPPCWLTGTYGNDAGGIDLLFYIPLPDDVCIFLAPPDSKVSEVIGVIIDIKPGGEQNNINLKSKGVVPVAVLTTDTVCAEMIDPDTVDFAGAAPQHWSFEDVDNDGDDDIIFHFRTQELALDKNSTEATLTASLLSGEEVSGTDEVRIVPSKKK